MSERLQKYLSRAGVASRRHSEELISAGRVAVNNKVIRELGTKVEAGQDLVTVDGKLVSIPEGKAYYVLYKPERILTTFDDPQGRPTIKDFLSDVDRRLFAVGRLDYDAEGALLLTDDGELSYKLMHPKFQVPRTYLVKVRGAPDEATLEKVRGGIRLEDGMARPLSISIQQAADKNTWMSIVVAEGRQHLIKRLCAAMGHVVLRLYRPSYAGVSVEGMRPGELRALTGEEISTLQKAAAGDFQFNPAREWKLPPRRHGRTSDSDEGDDTPPPSPRFGGRDGALGGRRGEGGLRPLRRRPGAAEAEHESWDSGHEENRDRKSAFSGGFNKRRTADRGRPENQGHGGEGRSRTSAPTRRFGHARSEEMDGRDRGATRGSRSSGFTRGFGEGRDRDRSGMGDRDRGATRDPRSSGSTRRFGESRSRDRSGMEDRDRSATRGPRSSGSTRGFGEGRRSPDRSGMEDRDRSATRRPPSAGSTRRFGDLRSEDRPGPRGGGRGAARGLRSSQLTRGTEAARSDRRSEGRDEDRRPPRAERGSFERSSRSARDSGGWTPRGDRDNERGRGDFGKRTSEDGRKSLPRAGRSGEDRQERPRRTRDEGAWSSGGGRGGSGGFGGRKGGRFGALPKRSRPKGPPGGRR